MHEAGENTLSHLEFFSLLVQDEIASREANVFDLRVRLAGFGIVKVFENFDFRFNESIFPSSLVRELAGCRFAEQKKNLVIAGPPGIGKTHIAKAIGHEMCRRGFDVFFRKTNKLLAELMSLSQNSRFERAFKKYLKADLIILDDFAFTRLDSRESEILYALADERLGRSSIILTSNRPPEDWYGIFPDPVIGGALLDRLVSGAVKVIVTEGRSYRREG